VGSSGAGKSTLLNGLLGEQRMATAPTRVRDDRGVHTTTHRQLFLLPGGSIVLDTPGMRELALLHGEGLETVFGDIAALAGSCRFRDCRHEGEPGCAVSEALARGDLDPDRLDHYRKLKDEANSWERRQDVRSRREDDRRWGRFLADAKKQLRGKRGEWD
jgi:ribosome biogenesis GTPase